MVNIVGALGLLEREAMTANRSPHTIRAYRNDVAVIGSLLGDVKHVAPDTIDIEALTIGDLKEAFGRFAGSHSPASVVRARSTWRRLYDTLMDEGIVEASPMVTVAAKAKAPARQPRPLNGWERGVAIELLNGASITDAHQRSAWPARDTALLATLLATGLRNAEVVGLSLKSMTIVPERASRELVVLGKGRKQRTVLLVESVVALVDEYLSKRRALFPLWPQRGSDPLFVVKPSFALLKRDPHSGGVRMTTQQVQYLVRRVCTQAGLSSALPRGAAVHALRHTFGSQMARSGEPLHNIAALMGHASISTTQGYLAPVSDDLAAALERQADALGLS